MRTAGLGVFTGGSDIVLYLIVVKDRLLLDLQERIWRASLPFAAGLQEHYDLARWVPHITLAHADLDAGRLGCAARLMAGEMMSWEVEVDHLLVIRQEPGQTGSASPPVRLGSPHTSTV